MGSYHGPKAKKQRRFGEVLIPRAKYQRIIGKRAYPPGDHGKEKTFRSGRRSDYANQLDEKQKLSFIYNIREKQLRRYFMEARQTKGPTGENLMRLLERRLDNMVYRAGFAATIWAARQMVVHGHINVNGRRLDLPSYSVIPGDVIQLREKMWQNTHVIESLEGTRNTVDYLILDKSAFQVTFTRNPERTEIPVPIQEQLVVEFYARLV
ncbi:MAG: 30S ribosomal protein S4 [Phototrophicaceae bacterium]|jgi:small subunit ribosomal protein S4